MYKYVKGVTVLSEERMPNSLEVAEEYHLWMPETDSLTPNGVLVDFIVKAYIERNNLKVSEYFYIDKQNISFQVYPEKMITQIMNEFISYLENNNITMSKETVYTFSNIPFLYYEEPHKDCEILSFGEYKKRKEEKSHD